MKANAFWKPDVTVAAETERDDRSRHRSPLVEASMEDYLIGAWTPLVPLVKYHRSGIIT